ncbi:MAG: tRNA (N(6)-L-threonylcarbamoyladenosine(37)-C(2))-methylthiotransferase [Candidatus Bathyarchaeia archaeon]
MGQTFYIETFGCSANKADSEIIVGLLRNHGLNLVDDPLGADFIIVNTCAVKAPTEQKVLRRLSDLSKLKGKLVVGGCLPAISMESIRDVVPEFCAAFCPRSLDRIAEIIDAVRADQTSLVYLSTGAIEKPVLPRLRQNRNRGIIEIAEGCLGSCSYCCVRFARGPLHSYHSDALVSQARSMLDDGCRELWITAQDTAAYGLDIGSSLPELLERICDLPYRFKIRVGMMNPKNVLPILDELARVYDNPKIYKFLHLPVQSGDNDILSAMRRGYTVEDFTDILDRICRPSIRMTLATDIIVGFPGETENQFQLSVELMKRVKPDIVNVSRFGKRPKAAASSYSDQLHGMEKKRRSRKLSAIAREISLRRNRDWIGWSGEALVTEAGPKGGWIARNYAYKPILLRSGGDLLGRHVNVAVTSATYGYLLGDRSLFD